MPKKSKKQIEKETKDQKKTLDELRASAAAAQEIRKKETIQKQIDHMKKVKENAIKKREAQKGAFEKWLKSVDKNIEKLQKELDKAKKKG